MDRESVIIAELNPSSHAGMAIEQRPVAIPDFATWKNQGRKIPVLTAYDYPTARLLDAAGVDCLLVGDSMGTTVQGHETTLPVTLDQVIYHSEMVARASRRALVVADLPFLSYHASRRQAILSAGRVLKETNCKAVKLEGGRRMAATIKAVVECDIPVMAHIGLTPQSIRRLGSYKVQRAEDALRDDAQAVVESGAFSVVLECVPAELAARVSAEIPIPTIGIGAGPGCDGQVLVFHDMVGLAGEFRPRFARRYADLGEAIKSAAANYARDVRDGSFPGDSESFH
jgi:3-methyl-2-oxobutanoate hydroxymethyltransferase